MNESSWDGTFLSWKTDFGKHVLEQFPLPDGSEPIPPDQPLQPKLLLETLPQIQTSHQSDVTSQGRNLNNQQSTSHPDVSPNNFSLSESTANFPPIMTSDNPLPAAPLAPWITPPPSVCQQLKEPHPDIKLPLDKDLPPDTLLNIRRGKTCELLYNKRVTPQSHWQDVRQLTLLVPDHATWLPGDVVTIYPKNFPDDVQALIDLQEWNEYADVPLQLVKSTTSYQTNIRTSIVSGIPESLRLVKGSTLRDLLTNNLDITAIPKRNFLQNMSYFTSDAMHRERLQEFCQPLYTDEFFDYCTRPRRSILEVLTDFPTVKFPWNQAAWIFPSIRGRQFSIANSSETAEWHQDSSEREVELLVAIVKYRTVLKKIRQGLCSRYLSSLEEGSKMQISFDRPSDKFYDLAFREKKRPIIMIAAGTGIAPCRNLIQERTSLASQRRSQDEQMGKMLLIYGSRNHSSDYFFQDDWISRDISKHLTVKTAFSRDQRDKIYVQDIIKRDKEEIYKLIEEGAVIYVCGSAGAMPKSVRQAILDVLCEFVDVGSGLERVEEVVKEKSEALLEQMSKVGRYVEEVW